MPSQEQYQRALQELRDLEKELELLNNATDPRESGDRLKKYIVNTKEGLTDQENNHWLAPDGCGCILL